MLIETLEIVINDIDYTRRAIAKIQSRLTGSGSRSVDSASRGASRLSKCELTYAGVRAGRGIGAGSIWETQSP